MVYRSLNKFLEGELSGKMNSTFQFWEILPNYLCCSCINLYFHQECMRMHAFLTPHWHIMSLIFFNYMNMIGMLHSWVLICVSEVEIFLHMPLVFPIIHWTLLFSQLIHMDAGHVKNMNSLTIKDIIFSSFTFSL